MESVFLCLYSDVPVGQAHPNSNREDTQIPLKLIYSPLNSGRKCNGRCGTRTRNSGYLSLLLRCDCTHCMCWLVGYCATTGVWVHLNQDAATYIKQYCLLVKIPSCSY